MTVITDLLAPSIKTSKAFIHTLYVYLTVSVQGDPGESIKGEKGDSGAPGIQVRIQPFLFNICKPKHCKGNVKVSVTEKSEDIIEAGTHHYNLMEYYGKTRILHIKK